MLVEKKPKIKERYFRYMEFFENARSAFKAILLRLGLPDNYKILIPSYIGWSPNEGSGVFDPISELGASYSLYRINSELHVDIDDLKSKLNTLKPAILLLIHYFGWPDPKIKDIVKIANQNGCLIIEDEAHALFSDLMGNSCGRYGLASIFSLHKMLPLESGGLMAVNINCSFADKLITRNQDKSVLNSLFQYDLAAISEKRIENYYYLRYQLSQYKDFINILRPELPKGVIPQSFPVLLKRGQRDVIYMKMNEAGYGLVSLYHTLIKEIDSELFCESYFVSKKIINIPLHQDIEINQLERMVCHLIHLIKNT
jgi:dTDP-4-amino-4,6-dideoxygalactose transaminase